MQLKKCGSSYLIRLEIGEGVIPSLTSIIKQERILSGWLQGIGAVDEVTVGTYDLRHKRYVKKTLIGDQELLNMTGNVSWLDKEPILHIHAMLADNKHHVIGGHLFEARTCVTVEMLLVPWRSRVIRQPDALTGLNLLHLGTSRLP
jgi:predicted DNA-binding protein with PD1-like motif